MRSHTKKLAALLVSLILAFSVIPTSALADIAVGESGMSDPLPAQSDLPVGNSDLPAGDSDMPAGDSDIPVGATDIAAYGKVPGNYPGNILRDGFAVGGSDITFYVDYNNGGGLYMKKDGKTSVVDPSYCHYLNIWDEQVYYIRCVNKTAQICSAPFAGGEPQVLFTEDIIDGAMNLFIENGVLYYQSANVVYRCDISGGRSAVDLGQSVTAFAVSGDNIYFTYIDEDTKSLSAYNTLDGTSSVVARDIIEFVPFDKGVYYTTAEGLYSYSDGEKSLVKGGSAANPVYADGVLYFESGASVYTLSADGELAQKCAMTGTSFNVLSGGELFFDYSVAEYVSPAEVDELLTIPPTGGVNSYKSWKQNDSRWGSMYLGNSKSRMKDYGCLVTAISMLLVRSGVEINDDTVFNPGVLCTMLSNAGCFDSSGALFWNRIVWVEPTFILGNDEYGGAVSLPATKAAKYDLISRYLEAGWYLTVCINTDGALHHVAVDDYWDGDIYIMDPVKNRTLLFDYPLANISSLRYYNATGPRVVPPTAIEFLSTQYYTDIGAENIFKLKYTPANAIKDVQWTNTDPTVAVVDSAGKIKALKDGTTKITVTSKSNSKIKAECTVTVRELKCDLDGDGAVTIKDFTLAKLHSQGVIASITPEQKINTDVNCSGLVDADDVLQLIKKYIGSIAHFIWKG